MGIKYSACKRGFKVDVSLLHFFGLTHTENLLRIILRKIEIVFIIFRRSQRIIQKEWLIICPQLFIGRGLKIGRAYSKSQIQPPCSDESNKKLQ